MAAADMMLLSWNVRGMNAPIKRAAVHDMMESVKASVACIQETKIQMFNDQLLAESQGHKFKANYSFLPASGTSGGILIAASEDHFRIVSSSRTRFTLTVRIQMLNDGDESSLTGVYGPQSEADKVDFLNEWKSMKATIQDEWLVCGEGSNRTTRTIQG
jgi:exonuclease III